MIFVVSLTILFLSVIIDSMTTSDAFEIIGVVNISTIIILIGLLFTVYIFGTDKKIIKELTITNIKRTDITIIKYKDPDTNETGTISLPENICVPDKLLLEENYLNAGTVAYIKNSKYEIKCKQGE
jgi:hypothetical protein